MNTDTLTEEDLEMLTDAFVQKSKMTWGETKEERLRAIIQMVIVDTMLTVEGVIPFEGWKPERIT